MKHVGCFLFYLTLASIGAYFLESFGKTYSGTIHLYAFFWSTIFALATLPVYVISILTLYFKKSIFLSLIIFAAIMIVWEVITVYNSHIRFPNSPFQPVIYVIKYSVVKLMAFWVTIWMFYKKTRIVKTEA